MSNEIKYNYKNKEHKDQNNIKENCILKIKNKKIKNNIKE